MKDDKTSILFEEGPLRVFCAGCQRPVFAAVTVESKKGRLCPDCAQSADKEPPAEELPAA